VSGALAARAAAPAAARRLRIEMVLPSLAAAGMETLVARLAEGLAARGHEVGVTCTIEEGPLAGPLRARGHRVSLVPAPGVRTNIWPRALAAHLRRLAPDVVHRHDTTVLKGARAARMARVPAVVGTLHGIEPPEPWVNHAFRAAGVRLLDRLVVVSASLDAFVRERYGVAPARLALVNNGVDVERFSPERIGGAPPFTRAPDTLVVGTVARLEPVKNQALLLDAFALARQERPHARLVLVGGGSLRDALEARCRALGIEQAVTFAGLCADTAPVYRALDVFVLASDLEGTSISVLEAMASGTCVVATAVGGTPALLGDGAYGVLVPPRDPPALAAALVALLGDAERRSTLAARARARVVAEYSTSAMVGGYERLFYDVATATLSEDALCAG
jgi:glycosyltransferase involved in cell wall biosynthesis